MGGEREREGGGGGESWRQRDKRCDAGTDVETLQITTSKRGQSQDDHLRMDRKFSVQIYFPYSYIKLHAE